MIFLKYFRLLSFDCPRYINDGTPDVFFTVQNREEIWEKKNWLRASTRLTRYGWSVRLSWSFLLHIYLIPSVNMCFLYNEMGYKVTSVQTCTLYSDYSIVRRSILKGEKRRMSKLTEYRISFACIFNLPSPEKSNGCGNWRSF